MTISKDFRRKVSESWSYPWKPFQSEGSTNAKTVNNIGHIIFHIASVNLKLLLPEVYLTTSYSN